MRACCMLLLALAFLVVGCKKEEPKIEINVPGVNMKVDGTGSSVNVPGVNLKVKSQ